MLPVGAALLEEADVTGGGVVEVAGGVVVVPPATLDVGAVEPLPPVQTAGPGTV